MKVEKLLPNSHGPKGAEQVGALALAGGPNARPGAPSAGGSEGRRVPQRSGGGGCEGRPPRKRKVLRSLMFSDHFEAPCGFGIIFSAFDLRQDLPGSRRFFFAPKPALRALVREKPARCGSLFLRDPNHWKTFSYRALRDSGPPGITKY